jgi:hypothetical protein
MAIIREATAILRPGLYDKLYELHLTVRTDRDETVIVKMLHENHMRSMFDRVFDALKAELAKGIKDD